jgi:hypothetical protein
LNRFPFSFSLFHVSIHSKSFHPQELRHFYFLCCVVHQITSIDITSTTKETKTHRQTHTERERTKGVEKEKNKNQNQFSFDCREKSLWFCEGRKQKSGKIFFINICSISKRSYTWMGRFLY